jgi:hypothetical protein
MFSFWIQIWRQNHALGTKTLQLALRRVKIPLLKEVGSWYFQQTNREPISNYRVCTWVLSSNFPAYWSFGWWNSFPLCHSQSYKKQHRYLSLSKLQTNTWYTILKLLTRTPDQIRGWGSSTSLSQGNWRSFRIGVGERENTKITNILTFAY